MRMVISPHLACAADAPQPVLLPALHSVHHMHPSCIRMPYACCFTPRPSGRGLFSRLAVFAEALFLGLLTDFEDSSVWIHSHCLFLHTLSFLAPPPRRDPLSLSFTAIVFPVCDVAYVIQVYTHADTRSRQTLALCKT